MIFTIIKHTRSALGGRTNLSQLLATASCSPVPAMRKATREKFTMQSIAGPFPNFPGRAMATLPNPSSSSFRMRFPGLAGLALLLVSGAAAGVISTAESKADASNADDSVTYLNVRHQARITRAVEEQRAYEKLPKIKKAIASMLESTPLENVLDAVDKYERVSIKIPKEQDWIVKEDELTKKLFLEEIAAVYGCYNADFSVEYTGSFKTPINIVNLRFYDLRLLVGWIVKDKTSKQLQLVRLQWLMHTSLPSFGSLS